MAGFRRPIFSVWHEIFAVINNYCDASSKRKILEKQAPDEILVGFLAAPLAYSNQRVAIRPTTSVTDASGEWEEGGVWGAGEATSFLHIIGKKEGFKPIIDI